MGSSRLRRDRRSSGNTMRFGSTDRNASLLEPVVETIEETKASIAAEVTKHVALLKKAGFEAQ